MYENLTRVDLVGPALARALGDSGWERLEASLVSGGKSNLTFELTSDAGQAVLRRPPDGPLLPGRTVRQADRRRPERAARLGRPGPFQERSDRAGHRGAGGSRIDGRAGVRRYQR